MNSETEVSSDSATGSSPRWALENRIVGCGDPLESRSRDDRGEVGKMTRIAANDPAAGDPYAIKLVLKFNLVVTEMPG